MPVGGNGEKADPNMPVAVWRERDSLSGEVVDAFVMVLRTSGCRWARGAGCTMCGYRRDTHPGVGPEHLRAQLKCALQRYGGEPIVKIYTSGSFLDPEEIPPDFAREVLSSFASTASRVLVESRPEYIADDALDMLSAFREKVWVAIGLESASDEVLQKCVNKGFTVDVYVEAARKLRSAGIPLKTYVLLKPPFLSEWMAVEDAVRTVEFAVEHSAEVSINPVNVQSGTLVEHLWRRGLYRPPWLWSVVEVLLRTHGKGRVVSYPTGGGKRRGAHNCGRCDGEVLRAIREYSLKGEADVFASLNCGCRERWRAIMEYGRVTLNSDDV